MGEQRQAVIADYPPNDGREWDCQCARCGSSALSEDCADCGGDGYVECDDPLGCMRRGCDGEIHECRECRGMGCFWACGSSGHGDDEGETGEPSWCEAHPLPGREQVQCGRIEWFVVERSAQVSP